jgi:hypothetical protein
MNFRRISALKMSTNIADISSENMLQVFHRLLDKQYNEDRVTRQSPSLRTSVN